MWEIQDRGLWVRVEGVVDRLGYNKERRRLREEVRYGYGWEVRGEVEGCELEMR